MYLGIIVEEGPSERVFSTPRHPYSQLLLASAPIADPALRHERTLLEGDVPSPVDVPSGCRFRTRCPLAQDICAQQVPFLRAMGGGQFAACHFAQPE